MLVPSTQVWCPLSLLLNGKCDLSYNFWQTLQNEITATTDVTIFTKVTPVSNVIKNKTCGSILQVRCLFCHLLNDIKAINAKASFYMSFC